MGRKEGRLFVVSGPSGSGKSTLCCAAVRQTKAQLSVSATTRPQSEDEVDGRDYYFLTEEQFRDKIRTQEFLEYASVFDHYYGTPTGPVKQWLDKGETVVLEIDVQGAAQVFEAFPQAIGVLVLAPSREELYRRLCYRKRDDKQTIDKRLAKAEWEQEQAQGNGHYRHTIINDDLNKAITELVELIG